MVYMLNLGAVSRRTSRAIVLVGLHRQKRHIHNNEGIIMSLYEHVVITRPDISTTQVEEFVQNLATKIENMGGSVEGAEYWGLRNLAYRMKKNRKAHYSLLKINALPETIHEIERQHRINEDILRYLSIRVDEFLDEPSPILKKREERKRRESKE
jgi:small subunit ribosomal protein S6